MLDKNVRNLKPLKYPGTTTSASFTLSPANIVAIEHNTWSRQDEMDSFLAEIAQQLYPLCG